MNGINQLMLGQLGQGGNTGDSGSKLGSRGKSEMEFHSLLSQKQEVKPRNQIESAQSNKTPAPDRSQASNQPSEQSNNGSQKVEQRATQQKPDQGQGANNEDQGANEQVAAQVKDAVEQSGGEVDAKEVVAQVLANKDIDLSQLNLDELFADIEAALSDLNIDPETITSIAGQMADAMKNAFANIAGQISQQLAQLDPGKALNLTEDEEVASDKLVSLNTEGNSKEKLANAMMKLDQNTGKNMAESDNSEAKVIDDKSTDDRGKLIDEFDKKLVVKSDGDKSEVELKDKLNLNKNELNLSKTQFTSNQNGLGGVSNLNQLNQVQAKLNQAQQMSIQGKLGTAEFKQGLSERVVFMMKGDMNTASLKLNPPELGPLEIKLNMNNTSKQADLTIMTQHALVKDSVEQALPRLRDMLADSGIQLNNVNVSDQSLKQNQQQSQQQGDNENSGAGTSSFYQEVFGNGEQTDEEIMTQLMMHRHRPDGLVDYYA